MDLEARGSGRASEPTPSAARGRLPDEHGTGNDGAEALVTLDPDAFDAAAKALRFRLLADDNYRLFAKSGGFSSSREGSGRASPVRSFYQIKGIWPGQILDAPDKIEQAQALIEGELANKNDFQPNPWIDFVGEMLAFVLARGPDSDEPQLAALSAQLYAFNQDFPAYTQLQDWDRDAHWHFFTPRPDQGFHHFRLPRTGEEVCVAALAERYLEELLAKRPALSRHRIGSVVQIGALSKGMLDFWSGLESPAFRETEETLRAMRDRFGPD